MRTGPDCSLIGLPLAGLALILSGALHAAEDAGDYQRQLSDLDVSRPESVCAARTSLRALMPNANPADRAAMFRAFRAFYIESVSASVPAFTKQMAPHADDIETSLTHSEPHEALRALLQRRPDIAKAGAGWFQCGFSVMEGEGDLYPDQDPATLLEFASELPPGLASYIRFRAREDAERIAEDAALQLTWEQLRERLARWERFAKDHPQLLETHSEVEPAIRSLATLYFFGIDNTPTFDFTTGLLNPELLASWQQYVALNRDSRYQPLIAALLPRLAADNQKITERDRPLFQQFGFTEEFGNWWRYFQFRMNGSR